MSYRNVAAVGRSSRRGTWIYLVKTTRAYIVVHNIILYGYIRDHSILIFRSVYDNIILGISIFSPESPPVGLWIVCDVLYTPAYAFYSVVAVAPILHVTRTFTELINPIVCILLYTPVVIYIGHIASVYCPPGEEEKFPCHSIVWNQVPSISVSDCFSSADNNIYIYIYIL